jgi:hypothetical protein
VPKTGGVCFKIVFIESLEEVSSIKIKRAINSQLKIIKTAEKISIF